MNFIKKNWRSLFFIICLLIVPVISFAQTGTVAPGPTGTIAPSNPSMQGKIINPLGTKTTLPDLITSILKRAIEIGIPIVALAIVYCGFLFVKAQGKPEELTKAKEALLWTLVGAAILLGALAIAQMIQSTVTAL